jgi:hypothetical protein
MTGTKLNPMVVDRLKKFRAKKGMIMEQLQMYSTAIHADSHVIKLDFNYLASQATQLDVLGTLAKKGACHNEN